MFTRVARRELNSEYRLRTSKSYIMSTNRGYQDPAIAYTYSSSDGIDNIASTALMVFASICNHYLQVRVFVEDLFDPAVIPSFLSWHLFPSWVVDIFLVVIIVTQALWPRDEFWPFVWRR